MQGLLQLGTLDGVAGHQVVLDGDVGFGEGQVGHLGVDLGIQGLHGQGALFRLGGADFHAGAAAQAVFGVHLHAELHAGQFLALGRHGHEAFGSAGQFFVIGDHGADGGVGAHEGALAALDAVVGHPFGHVDGHTALFTGSGAQRHDAGGFHGGHGQLVAALGQDGTHHTGDVVVVAAMADFGTFGGVSPGFGVLDLDQGVHALVHGGDVHVDDLVALHAVGLLDGFLQQGHGLVEVDHVGQLEESGLHDHVDAAAQTHFLGHGNGVNVEELQVLAGDGALHGSRQVLFHVFQRPVGVQHEGTAVLDAVQDVVLGDIGGLVAGDVVGLGDEVGRLDGALAEAQVGHGEATGLLGVVSEVGLSVHVGVVTDDLDGLLVGTHGTVGAQTEELALHGAGGHGVDLFFNVEAQVGHVVVDAHGEVVLGSQAQHVVEHGLGHAGGEVLGAQTVTAAHDGGSFALFHEGSAHVLVQGLAQGTGFLGAVEDGDGGGGGGDGLQQVFGREGTEQMHFHQTHALAAFVQVVDGFLDDFTGRTHADDHAVGFGVAHIVEQAMLAAGDGGHFLHVFQHDAGHGVIVQVAGFAVLEEDVGVLGGAADMGMFRVHGIGAELFDLVPGNQLADVFVIDGLDLLHFVRGTETVEEVAEGHAGVKGGQVGDQGHVHAFLHRRGAEEGKTGLAAGHDVLMVTEDGQGVGSQGTGRNMEDAGQQFAGDLVHVGDHEQQALGSGVGAGQRTGSQHTVHGTGGAGFGLHFTHGHGLAHQVLATLGSHFVHDFAHDGRRGNGVNGSRVRQSVGNIRGGVIAVHGFHFRHLFLLARLSWRACFSGMDTPASGGLVQTERIHRIMPWHEAGAARAEEARKNGRDRACSQWMSPTTKLFA